MRLKKLSFIFLILSIFGILTACEEETTGIGSSISQGEVYISIDTLSNQKLNGRAVRIENFDSKTGNLMIGSIQTEKYGKLSCSFVTRLMCAANLGVADSLLNPDRVDSCKLIMGAVRDDIVGDSLAPQKLAVYKLTQQLNSSTINNTFTPQPGVDYNPFDVFATKSYTVSEIANKDSVFYNNNFIELSVDLPVSFGQEVFRQYKDNPSIFQWPQTMAEKFLPGLFITPTFGNGCVANINAVYVAVFYYSLAEVEEEDEDGEKTTIVKHVNNMAVPFTVSPEVLSSNNIKYEPSQYVIDTNNNATDGEVVITTPGGYIAEFVFPAQDLIDIYQKQNIHLSTVNDLVLYIPGEAFEEELGAAENLLMIKSSEYEEFFAKNKTPDNKTSFTGVYDSKNGRYNFATMREYFLNLLKKDTITDEDITFTLVPVEIETETVGSYYGSGTTYVTKCVPYISKPTLTLLHTNDATITFSFSTQMID